MSGQAIVPPPSRLRPAFAIFEGGGAKGIAHLGAAEAALNEGVEFIGVAGASAGAFVAALLAAGYRGKELFNPETRGSDLLARQNMTPTDLLGQQEWKSFQSALTGFRQVLPWAAVAGCPGAWLRSHRTLGFLFGLLRRKGHFRTNGVREFVNYWLRRRLVELYASEGLAAAEVPTRIHFRHLDYRRFKELRPLKIVATDVQACKAILFSQEDTPDAEVAEAVAASIAIPLVFRPVEMRTHNGGPYADGGLTYNLPLGVFAEEKLAYERRFPRDPPVPILAFTLEDPPANPGAQPEPLDHVGFFAYLPAVARAAIFGSQEITRRLMADVVRVPLQIDLSVLGFDADWPAVERAFEAGRVDTLRVLRRSLRLRPDRVRGELGRFAAQMRLHVNQARHTQARPSLRKLRVALVCPLGTKSLRVMYSAGMDDDADDRMVFDRDGPGIPQAFRERDLIAFAVAPGSDGRPRLAVPWMMTKYETALLWPELRSVLALPIFPAAEEWAKSAEERAPARGVLVFDSNEDLLQDLESSPVLDWLISVSVAAAALIPDVAAEE